MARPHIHVVTQELTSISKGTASVVLHAHADRAQSPVNVGGRMVDFPLSPQSIAFLFSTLAGMPAYRHVFRAVADELDARSRVADDPGRSPVERVRATDVISLHNSVRDAIMEAVKQ